MRSVAIRGADRSEARCDRCSGVHCHAAAAGDERRAGHDRRMDGGDLARVRPRGLDPLQVVRFGVECGADAAHPHREVVLHDLTDLGLAEGLVRAEGVLDASGGILDPTTDQAEVLRTVVVLAELAQAAGQLRRRSERRHAVAAHEAGDRRVVHARLLGELPLRHLLGFELRSQPLVEGSAIGPGHAPDHQFPPNRPISPVRTSGVGSRCPVPERNALGLVRSVVHGCGTCM